MQQDIRQSAVEMLLARLWLAAVEKDLDAVEVLSRAIQRLS